MTASLASDRSTAQRAARLFGHGAAERYLFAPDPGAADMPGPDPCGSPPRGSPAAQLLRVPSVQSPYRLRGFPRKPTTHPASGRTTWTSCTQTAVADEPPRHRATPSASPLWSLEINCGHFLMRVQRKTKVAQQTMSHRYGGNPRSFGIASRSGHASDVLELVSAPSAPSPRPANEMHMGGREI